MRFVINTDPKDWKPEVGSIFRDEDDQTVFMYLQEWVLLCNANGDPLYIPNDVFEKLVQPGRRAIRTKTK